MEATRFGPSKLQIWKKTLQIRFQFTVVFLLHRKYWFIWLVQILPFMGRPKVIVVAFKTPTHHHYPKVMAAHKSKTTKGSIKTIAEDITLVQKQKPKLYLVWGLNPSILIPYPGMYRGPAAPIRVAFPSKGKKSCRRTSKLFSDRRLGSALADGGVFPARLS